MCLSLQGCRGMCLTKFAHFDLKFPILKSQHASCEDKSQDAYIVKCNMHLAMCKMHLAMCNMDNFLLNQKGLVLMSILPKKSCNIHCAHIATESILRLTSRYLRMVP